MDYRLEIRQEGAWGVIVQLQQFAYGAELKGRCTLECLTGKNGSMVMETS